MSDEFLGTWSNIQLAQHYLSLDQPQKGLEALTNGSDQSLDVPFYWSLRAAILLELDEPNKALATVKQGLSQFPDFTVLLALGAEAHKQKAELADAERMILKALAVEPENVDYLVQYASLLLLGGQTEKAQRVIDRARQYDPENPDIDRYEAYQAYIDGDQGRAIDLIKSNLQHDPENTSGQQFLGNIYLEKGDVAAGNQMLGSAAYLSGGKQGISAEAREAKIYSHWLLFPLRLFYKFGSGQVWVAFMVGYFVLRAVAPPIVPRWFAYTYIFLAIYSWVAPPVLRWWFNYRFGKIG